MRESIKIVIFEFLWRHYDKSSRSFLAHLCTDILKPRKFCKNCLNLSGTDSCKISFYQCNIIINNGGGGHAEAPFPMNHISINFLLEGNT